LKHILQLIEATERLNMSGEIGDGKVAYLHELAALARLELDPRDVRAVRREQFEAECG